ncbi:N-acetylglucosamine-6-phosphate deacetylase [Kineosporia sp. NBRC 101677]|uniref:N-acetylglucosamine-6-phosphate deacetylase n=1 Tax=Kineosporia sp. NBRC 101677 TaxID=3032197 RepID=UPI0024A4ADBD|nr:N-acetylglucosamine-6-phosphate deacetylase [Kineosporia sp. NBRC 101677]GLY18782.1 N-acetylglucosamine-6-phosphate deacetylase [Kineosporia sp. NBRC 101677]
MSGTRVAAVTGASVLDPVTGQSRRADVVLAEGRVVSVGSVSSPVTHSGEVLDATGLTLVPGLIDLQVNGAAGVDITADPEGLWRVAAALPRYGVTSFLPTLVTTDVRTRLRAMEVLADGRPDAVPAGARPLGLHFEGPMLAPAGKGAHDERFLRSPSLDLIEGWDPESGVLMATLAPELPGALEVIRELADRGVLVSMGHTAATLEQFEAGAAAGARAVTHLYNAMTPFHHQQPGPAGAVLDGGGLVAGVIVDGLHVHPRTVSLTWNALGSQRFLAVSDTTAALGQPDGEARLGSRRVIIRNGSVRLADDGTTLAGSAVSLDQCLRLLATFTGRELGEVLPAATTVPAALLGRDDLGRIRPGSVADLVLLNDDQFPVATLVEGNLVYDWYFAPAPEWTEGLLG